MPEREEKHLEMTTGNRRLEFNLTPPNPQQAQSLHIAQKKDDLEHKV